MMEKFERQEFWMVWCQCGGAPTRQHMSKAEAVKEAERLSRLNPDKVFFVLKTTAAITCEPRPTRRVKLLTAEQAFADDIPF